MTSIAIGVFLGGLFALLGDGLRAETALPAAACTAVIVLVALRHGGLSAHVRRLREKPNDVPPR